MTKPKRMPRFKQSVCAWCFRGVPLATLARRAKALGLAGIDIVEPSNWATLQKRGLICTMTPSHPIDAGLANPAHHADCVQKIARAIEETAVAGFPNVICFAGVRSAALSGEQAMKNCVRAAKKVVGLAEKRKVTLCMELLNSKIDHDRYICDRTAWGAELVRRVSSERFKLLYDIYHMQVQEGDIIATIRKHAGIIAHYHTAGVPGRHELGPDQELNYPAIVRAIAQTGFRGYIAHEFIPKANAFSALRDAVSLCQV